ncbi:MAG: FAD/NAD(P)-binding protein, partial [Pseudomonadota bacterium]
RKPDWLTAANQLVSAGDLYGVNAPREFYGDYMESRVRQSIETLRSRGTNVSLVDDCATSLAQSSDGLTLATQSGRQFEVQSIDIAPGGPETMRFNGDDGPFSAPSVFGHEHRISEHILRGAEIFCIGGNAAMLDVLRLCQSQLPDDELKFIFCAPEGEIPPPLVPRLPRKLTRPNLTKRHLSAESFLLELKREIARAEAHGDERREIREGFRAFFLEHPLHHFVTETAEAAKVSKVLRFWLRGGTRDTIFDMRKLVKTGTVRILKGRVLGIETTGQAATVLVEDDTGEMSRETTGFVVNCAGAGPQSKFDRLTEDLIAKGFLTVASGNGLVTGARCQLSDPRVRYLSPAVTRIGEETIAMPLYDAHMLRTYVTRSAMV